MVTHMNSKLLVLALVVCGRLPAQQPAPPVGATLFDTPAKAAAALVDAAEQFDFAALHRIFGPDGQDIVFTGEFAQDRKQAAAFAAEAREKMSVSVDPRNANRAFILAGAEEWPMPVPLVRTAAGKWWFDAKAGRQELLHRRIGSNELDAIEICRGYVEGQHEYATQQRAINEVNQYAQRIISSPGKRDGLGWQNPDGTWGGPVGANIAKAIQEGYATADPYHGYFFKVLKAQGPAAPLGEMDFVVKGVMIGGFALVASPAVYGVTGVRTFIVSHDGVVYEKDLGWNTLDEFKKMERFNPDQSWAPVPDEPK